MHSAKQGNYLRRSLFWVIKLIQSNSVNTDTEGATESVCINGVSVLSGLNLEKMQGLCFFRTKQTVSNNEVSVFKWVSLKQGLTNV